MPVSIKRSRWPKARLYGTTALVTGALAWTSGPVAAQEEEQKIRLETTGFMNNYFGATSVDEASDADFEPIGYFFDGELQFIGSTVLANGLEVGARIELEVPDPSDLDEMYGWFRGGFGEVRAGATNAVNYKMGLGAFSPQVGVLINSGWVTVFNPPPKGALAPFRSPAISTAIAITNDDNTISYFTPRIGGFQFGVSYVPRASFRGRPTNGLVNNNASFSSEADRYSNGFSVAGNWIGQAGGFDLGFSAGYARAQANNAVEALGGDDIQQVMAGGTIGYGGFFLDGSYANEIDGRVVNDDPVSTTEGRSFIVGLRYTTGPWNIGGSYINGKVEDVVAISGDDEMQAAEIGVEYELGPGIKLAGGVMWSEWDPEDSPNQQGWAGVVGFTLSF